MYHIRRALTRDVIRPTAIATPAPAPTRTPAPLPLPTTLPTPTQTIVIATKLPCDQFEFVPGTLALTSESKQSLDECVIPMLKTLPNLYLRVRASAAWPGPAGKFTRYQIQTTARKRATLLRAI